LLSDILAKVLGNLLKDLLHIPCFCTPLAPVGILFVDEESSISYDIGEAIQGF